MTKIRLFISTCAISTLAASHPAYNSGSSAGIGATHPAYNSGDSKELGVPHPGYKFGDDLGASTPHNTTQEGAKIVDELLKKTSLILPDTPKASKIKYPKDESIIIGTYNLDQGLVVPKPTASKTDPGITPAASHPAYNSVSSADVGGRHPAYNSADNKELGVPHPGYKFGENLGTSTPQQTTQEGAKIVDELLQKTSLVLPNTPKASKIKYPKDESIIIGTYNLDQGLAVPKPTASKTDPGITPAASHPAYNSGRSADVGARHPAYNSADKKELGLPHPGYKFGENLGTSTPQQTTQEGAKIVDELLQKTSLVLPNTPKASKIKYPKDESIIIGTYNLDQGLAVPKPTASKTDPGITPAASHPAYNSGSSADVGARHPAYNSADKKELGLPHPGYKFGENLGTSTPQQTTQEGAKIVDELLQKTSLVLPNTPKASKIKYPKDESIIIGTYNLDQGLAVPKPTASKTDPGITPVASHPAYNSGRSTDAGATHPAYNSADSKELGLSHPGYKFGDDLGLPTHKTTENGKRLADEILQKTSLALPDNPKASKIQYPKDQGTIIDPLSLDQDLGVHRPASPLIDPHSLDQDLGVHRPASPLIDPRSLDQDLGVHRPASPLIDPHNLDQDLGVHRPASPLIDPHNLDQDLGVNRPASPLIDPHSLDQDLGVHRPASPLIDPHNLDQDLGVHRPASPLIDPHSLDQDLGVHRTASPLIDPHSLDQDLGVHRTASPLIDPHSLDQDLGVHRPASPLIDPHSLDQDLAVHRPASPKIDADADDSGKASETPCSKIVEKFTLIQNSVIQNATSKVRSGSIGSRAAAAGNAVKAATDAGEAGDNTQFRFGLSTDQIKLSIRKKVHFSEENDGSVYSNTLNALEKTLDSTQAIRKNGKGMTFWISGIYAQGETDSIFGNPASTDKHYGIIVGTHYKHEPTQQIFGIAFDVGTGRSVAKTNKDQKTETKMAELTLYYNKMLSKNWKFNLCNSFMNEWEHHQRPFTNDAGVQQIAASNSIDQEFTSNIGIGYKQEFSRDNYLEPFFSFNYTFTKQYAHREKNVSGGNAYNSNSSDQIGLQFGIKSSFSTELSNSKTLVVMPKLSYTNFAKMSNFTQKSVNISSGQVSMSQSGTPGRNLLSATIGFGVADYQADTTTRIAYTGNVQKQRRSHEVMVDWSIKF